MAVEAVIENAEKINSRLTLNGTVKRGDVLAHNGTGWVQADASDAVTNLYAQYVAMEGGESGEIIPGCKSCVLVDADAPYAANGTVYVSETAGAITNTRPTVSGSVIQVIGRCADTSTCQIDIEPPKEIEQYLYSVLNLQNGGAHEAHVADGATDEWAGADVDAAAVGAVFVGRFPSGLVGGPLAAALICNTQASTALDIDVTYVAAFDGAANTGDAGSTQTALTSASVGDNVIASVDISDGMDADYIKAGRNFGVSIDPDGGDFIPLFLYMRYLVV
jgi:hypothetical protein